MLTAIYGTYEIIDDLLEGDSNDEGHLSNLEAVFVQFKKFGLGVKLPKSGFLTPLWYILDYVFWSMVFNQPTKRSRPSKRYLPLGNVTELLSFLGMLVSLTNLIRK